MSDAENIVDELCEHNISQHGNTGVTITGPQGDCFRISLFYEMSPTLGHNRLITGRMGEMILSRLIAARLSPETTRKLALLDEIMGTWKSQDTAEDAMDAVADILLREDADYVPTDAERS